MRTPTPATANAARTATPAAVNRLAAMTNGGKFPPGPTATRMARNVLPVIRHRATKQAQPTGSSADRRAMGVEEFPMSVPLRTEVTVFPGGVSGRPAGIAAPLTDAPGPPGLSGRREKGMRPGGAPPGLEL